MLRNYFKTALRNLVLHKVISLVNIFCMSIAISCSLIAYLYVFDNLDSEWFHKNGANIFMVEHKAIEDGDLETFGNVPAPLGPALLHDHSFIVNAVRITDESVKIRMENQEFDEWVRFADPGFFDMFSFPLASGDPASLNQKNSVILSRDAAIRYFGEGVNPVGKTMSFEFAPDDKALFTVTGVAEERWGPSSCAQFGVLVNYENAFRKNPETIASWNNFTPGTFIQVDDPSRIAELTTRMQPYVPLQNAADKANMPVKEFLFQNLRDLTANRVRNSIVGSVAWAPIIVLSSISIFLLLLACFNCINVNIASVGTRLKEIGIRKVIGGNKKQLVFQFLTENLLISFASFLVAIALTGSLLLPAFEDIAGTGLNLDFWRIDLWFYLLLLFSAVAICSGLYPALYISSFQPIAILRDKLQLSGKNNFTRSLLTVQFVIAFITIITSVGLTLNYYDMQGRDWGYKRDNLLTMQVENETQYNLMKKTALEQPSVTTVSGARNQVGFYQNDGTMVQSGEMKTNVIVFDVATNYFDMMGFQVLSGKLPSTPDAVVVNEKLVKQFGWQNAIGQAITFDSVQYNIAAVVKDFHHEDFTHEINAVVFTIGNEKTFTNVVMKIENGTGTRTKSAMETMWKRHFADSPFTLHEQEESFNDMYSESQGILRIFLFTTTIALLMSCIGLFGLASQRVQAKRKEICIRKIFGVPLTRAVLIVNGRFLILIAIAAVVASPLSYMILNALLDSIYMYRMDVNSIPFVISYSLMAGTILITLSEKIYQIAKTNPAIILRNE